MRETERFESEHTSEWNRVIASEHRLSHVSIGEQLRGRHPRAVRGGRRARTRRRHPLAVTRDPLLIKDVQKVNT